MLLQKRDELPQRPFPYYRVLVQQEEQRGAGVARAGVVGLAEADGGVQLNQLAGRKFLAHHGG